MTPSYPRSPVGPRFGRSRSAERTEWGARVLVLAVAVGALGGCSRGRARPTAASASASAAVIAPSPAPAASGTPYVPVRSVPRVGPAFAVLPGEGIGPIRFGATPATVERHMERPCDEKTPELCRYFAAAVEFAFTNGVVAEIRIHRLDRPAGKGPDGTERAFGNFNGAIPADPGAGRLMVTTFGMHADGVAEGLGKPLRVEKVDGTSPAQTVARHHYDGLVVEFDRVADAPMPIVGGFRVIQRAAAK